LPISRPRPGFRDGTVAGAVAGVISGLPSTVWTLARRGDLFESTAAAGTIVLDEDSSRGALLAAGAATHACISLGWGVVLSALLRGRPPIAAGAAAGLAIAAVDLGGLGRRRPRVRALDPAPQVLDHVVYGVVVAMVIRSRRRQSA
jgi:hypothetical protein